MKIVPRLFLRFNDEVERQFQESAFERVKPTLRLLSLLLGAMFAAYAVRDWSDTRAPLLAFSQNATPALFFLCVFGLSFVRAFRSFWQPFIALGGFFAAAVSLNGLTLFMQNTHPAQTVAGPAGDFPVDALFFGQQLRLLLVCLSTMRLGFRCALPLYLTVLAGGTSAFLSKPALATLTVDEVSRFLQPTVAILVAVVLASLIEEQLARRAFWANHQLEEERNDERRMREQTEGKLHVLAQAIGGIVHDLGGPLTTVQLGAETLDLFLDEDVDKKTLHGFTSTIVEGVQLLNFLRLSLIEQTRVLEDRPTPLSIKPVALCAIIESGRRFQKPYTGARAVRVECEDVQIFADEMKMVTVFMNLIGNALKYSDDDVSVSWRAFQQSDGTPMLLVAVLDKGTEGRGITHEEAQRLFTAFGRLDSHSQIEGTGLGLLSVQKIALAHGGEAFLEGFEDGTPDSKLFSTATGDYPTMLEGNFRTAFVVTCRLASEAKVPDTFTAIR